MLEKTPNMLSNYVTLLAYDTLGNFNMQKFMLGLKARYAKTICDICVFVSVSQRCLYYQLHLALRFLC